MNRALARKLGIPFVNLEQFGYDAKLVDLISAEMAIKHKVLPLADVDGLVVGRICSCHV